MQHEDPANLPDTDADVIEALERAMLTIPAAAIDAQSVLAYRQYLEGKQLENALNLLERHGTAHTVSPAFWTGMCDAAVRLALYQRANRFKRLSKALDAT